MSSNCQSNKPVAAPRRKRELKCQYCPSTFISNNNLRRHLYELHKHEAGNLPIPPKIEVDPVNCCRRCNLKFESRDDWIKHKMADARVTKPFGPFQWGCDICGAYVSRKEKLLNHIHNHVKVPESSVESSNNRRKLSSVAQLEQQTNLENKTALMTTETKTISRSPFTGSRSNSSTVSLLKSKQPKSLNNSNNRKMKMINSKDSNMMNYSNRRHSQDDFVDNDSSTKDNSEEEQLIEDDEYDRSNVAIVNQDYEEEEEGEGEGEEESVPEEDSDEMMDDEYHCDVDGDDYVLGDGDGDDDEEGDEEEEEEDEDDEEVDEDDEDDKENRSKVKMQGSKSITTDQHDELNEEEVVDDDDDDEEEEEEDDEEEEEMIGANEDVDSEENNNEDDETRGGEEDSNASSQEHGRIISKGRDNGELVDSDDYEEDEIDQEGEERNDGEEEDDDDEEDEDDEDEDDEDDADMDEMDDEEEEDEEGEEVDEDGDSMVERLNSRKAHYSCDLCQLFFESQQKLQQHVKMHFLNGPGSVSLAELKAKASKSRSSSSDVVTVSIS